MLFCFLFGVLFDGGIELQIIQSWQMEGDHVYVQFNPNPIAARVGDCAVRATAKALGISWEEAYIELVLQGLIFADMPSANNVFGAVLRRNGFKRHTVPNECPDCYTVKDFAQEHPKGVYVIGLNNHVVTMINGDWFDSWDSGEEIPVYYWRLE